MLVGGHGHTIGAAADQDAHASFSGHPFCKRVGMIRVIDAGTVWCTVVDDLDAALLQPGDQGDPQVSCSVVIGQVNPHGCKLPLQPGFRDTHSVVDSHGFLCVTQAQKNLEN